MAINVIKPGLSSTLQDGGREGYYHLGIPPSGALDRHALAAANLLVGNPIDATALECTLLGPELFFEQDTLFAVSGAVQVMMLDGKKIPMNTSVLARRGQQLKCGFATLGARSYLAIAGGFDVPEVLGCRSTYSLGSLGGYLGRKLLAGDALPVTAACGLGMVDKQLPEMYHPQLSKHAELRVLPGMYIHRLTDTAVDSFFHDQWTVSSESDRIGYRFHGGQPLEFKPRTPPFGAGSDPSNIVDACYPIGSIQLPGGRTPIVLQRDAVSGGGYMTLGTVISCDLDILGQLQPHSKVIFSMVTMEQALAARGEHQRRIQRLVTSLS